MPSHLIVLLLFFLTTALLIWRRRNSMHLRLLCIQGMEDDSDMKIAGAEPPLRRADDPDIIADHVEDEIEKGNIVKARLLGISLSDLFFAEAMADSNRQIEPLGGDRFRRQLDLLHAYVTKIGLAATAPSVIIADTAFNVFMEEVRAKDEMLYDLICESEAFSLYLLCIRTANKADYTIGGVFARLCDREEDDRLEAFGESEYRRYLDLVEEMVEGVAFS